MKRIQSACICQTLRFSVKDPLPAREALPINRDEVARYRAQLDRSGTKYKILDQTEQEDGAIVLRIIKQYNTSPVGDYLD